MDFDERVEFFRGALGFEGLTDGLRRMGIVETGRGVVRIIEPEKLEKVGSDTLWL